MRQGKAFWPGVERIESCTYTCSRGTMPGTAIVTISPQNIGRIAQFGTLVITDGVGTIRLPNCRLNNVYGPRGDGPKNFTLEIADRRWKWQNFGVVHGFYNQRDPRNFILRWSRATVPDMMAACLQAMGETDYVIQTPTVQTSTEEILPATSWDVTNPAFALQQFCSRIGCEIAYDIVNDRAVIQPTGDGAQLPPGDIHRETPSIRSPVAPDRIVVVGAPVRYNVRIPLIAVGQEWDGSYRPIDYLSYAPTASGIRHIVKVEPDTVGISNVFTLTINGRDLDFTATAATVANVTAGLTAAVNSAGGPQGLAEVRGITATDQTTHLLLTGPVDGTIFTVQTQADIGAGAGDPHLQWDIEQQGTPADGNWNFCAPPIFPGLPDGTYGVRPTDRLSLRQAQALARKSVFRTYRMIACDPFELFTNNRVRPLLVPGFGRIERIQQIIPMQTQVIQLTPQPQDNTRLGPDGQPLDRPFYDGYQKDAPARVYGSYFYNATGIRVTAEGPNTAPEKEVAVNFTIDQEMMLVVFDQYVFLKSPASRSVGRCVPAKLVLETSCQVRDATNNQVIRYTYEAGGGTVPGGTPPYVAQHDDIQLNFYGVYNEFTHRLERTISDRVRAQVMGQYYAAAEARKFDLQGAVERVYNGIVPIACDGAIAQVTYNVGGGGFARTQASRQFEHSTYVPTFPERIRLQYLAPAQRRALDLAAGANPERLAGPSLWGAKK